MLHRGTSLGTWTFMNYPRQIKLSEKQNPKYWEWDGTTIKSKGKRLLNKYIEPSANHDIIMNNGNIKPDWLRAEYAVVGFKGKKPYCIVSYKYSSTDCWREGLTGVNAYAHRLIDGVKLTKKEEKMQSRFYLCTIADYERVIANSTQVGKPKYHIITGQDAHVGLNPHIRTKIVNELHNWYAEEYLTLTEQESDIIRNMFGACNRFPIHIELEIFDTVKNIFDKTKEGNGRPWDVDNRGLMYTKTFKDFLVKGHKELEIPPFIPDDDRLHISNGNNCYFTPIGQYQRPKIVVHVFSDNREVWNKFKLSKKANL